LIGQVFLEAYEELGNPQYLAVAESICNWMLTLPREQTPVGSCISYHGRFQSSIHNSNLLGAALLARTWKHTRREELLSLAGEAMRYSCRHQLPDGAWWYGEEPKYRWIDNFHTGYNLTGLRVLGECTGATEFEDAVRRGYEFYRKHFFVEDGTPRYFHNHTYPIDVHCVAQSILSPIEFKHLDSGGVRLARSVFDWAMKNMCDERGFFYYRKLPYCTIRTSYMRWSQAWMFLALATLAEELTASERRAPARETVHA
jgi:hypothetical protein